LLAVGREVEPENLVGFEVGQLYGLPAVQRQRPDIRDSIDCVYEGQSAPVWHPAQSGSETKALRDVKHLDWITARERDDCDRHARVRLLLAVEAGNQAAVGRDGRI